MLTLPRIETRAATPYLATRHRVTIPFGDVPGKAFDAVEAHLKGQGATDFGPAIFRYTLIDMPRLEIDIGFVTPHKLTGNGDLVAGELPAGRYATTTYTGPYDDLMEVNAVLIGWAKHKGIDWDVEATANGDRFASRVEFYLDPPIGDPSTWRTEVAIKLKD